MWLHAILILLAVSTLTQSSFNESLTIDTLPDGKLLLVFDFTLSRPLNQHHSFDLFPRTLGQILDLYEIEALDLTLTQGRWLSNAWGWSTRSAPSGADLWVWLRPSLEPISERWVEFTNAISGLFCSSLNFLDHTITSSPSWSWPQSSGTRSNISTTLIHGSLARESVCTENLTPWTKLLPCGARQGLGKVLNGYKLFDANFHSIQTRVKSTCAGQTCIQTLAQSIVVVLDPLRTKSNPDWSITALLDRTLDSSCPVADSLAKVSVVFPESVKYGDVRLYPETYTETTVNGRRVAEFRIANETQIRMEYLHPEESTRRFRHAVSTARSPILVSRYITGPSLDSGTLHMDLTNPTNMDLDVTMYTILPWFLRIYLHTLLVQCNQHSVSPTPWRHTFALDRKRPTTMEMGLVVPKLSQCTWQVHFDRAFLHFSEHRPDAHRGFEIGSTIVSIPNAIFESSNYTKWPTIDLLEQPSRLFTEIIQVQLPTPDFSMPYNVITFTSTILAFFFGVMFSLTAHRFYSYKLVPTVDKKGRVAKVPKLVGVGDYIVKDKSQ